MTNAHVNVESVQKFSEEQKDDVKAKWFEFDPSSEGKVLQGEYLALRKHRIEVAGLVAQEMGVLGDVIMLEEKIRSRKNELDEAGTDAKDDEYLLNHKAMLVAASRLCLLKVIDHPTVKRVMDYTHVKMQEIRGHFMKKKKSRSDVLVDSDVLQEQLSGSTSQRYLETLIRKSINASMNHTDERSRDKRI